MEKASPDGFEAAGGDAILKPSRGHAPSMSAAKNVSSL
jgi:hypothetical protein